MTRCVTTTCAILLVIGGSIAQAVAQATPAAARGGETATRNVTLPLAEYNRLLDLSARARPQPTDAPVATVLTSADLRIRVDRDHARGTFAMAGTALRPSASRVTLLSGATLVDASANGRPLPLLVERGAHTAIVPGPGPFALTLEWAAPLTFAPGRASFTLPVPGASATRATIDLPGEQAEVHLSTGIITKRTVAGGRTTIEAALEPGSTTRVWWSMRDNAATTATRDVRALADVMTLVTLGDSDVRMAALVDVSVVQGELRTLAIDLPAGYELTGVSGPSVIASDLRERRVTLTMADPAARRQQFIVGLERPHEAGSFVLDTDVIAIRDVQRERGEIAVEGTGTLDLTATERDSVHRMDVREMSPSLQSLARLPVLAAFRYQRQATTAPGLSLDVKRFQDAGVLAAVADDADATTLITSEGRMLTEVTLHIQNRAQPFLKVAMPQGASIVSVTVAGEAAKPVSGADGTRIPLLRPGFRPNGVYAVSFVYVVSGQPVAGKGGDVPLALPRMDLPIGIVKWEVFVPERYTASVVGGNAFDDIIPPAAMKLAPAPALSSTRGIGAGNGRGSGVAGGVPGGVADNDGRAPDVDGSPQVLMAEKVLSQALTSPSQNVINLQRRTAGVLPVRIDVPRAGTSHQLVKPLVVDQETTVTLRFKKR